MIKHRFPRTLCRRPGLNKSLWLLAIVPIVVAAALVFGSGAAGVDAQLGSAGLAPARVTTIPLAATLEKGSEILIAGSGFAPNQEIFIAVRSGDGLLTEISGRVAPPTFSANEDGAFAATWDLSRWARRGIGAEGIYTLQVVNSNYELTASSPLGLCDPEKLEAVFCAEGFVGR